MKIAMIFPDHSSEKGISKYSMDLIKNIGKQGLKVDEITFMQGKPWTIFKKLAKIKNYGVLHLQHEYNLLGYYGLPYFPLLLFLKLFKKTSLIITMHTVPSKKAEFIGSKIKTFFRKPFYKTQNWLIKKVTDNVVVHSGYFKKILVDEYGFKEDKIMVFPHAIIEDIKTATKSAARKELNLSGGVYLLIGTMTPDHGHDVIIRQANKIGKTIVVATNPVAINYRNEEKIKNYLKLNQEIVKKKNFENFVRFDIGQISYDKWWKYFSAADLVLLPYRGGIGSGIFADAMAVKKPVVGSNIPYFQYIAKDYGCINLPKTDKDLPKTIRKAMKPKNYKKMISECKRYFNENGLTPISKKYIKFYRSLK